MKKQIVGTQIYTSSIAFGGDIAVRVSEKEFMELLDKYVQLGGNHIDTAALYSGGESERRIGRWLRTGSGKHDILVATKGAFPGGQNREISRIADVESDLDESLKRLGVSCIDLYYLHRDDPKREAEEIMDIMLRLVKKGKIRYLGCSNWRGERIKKANRYAESLGETGFAASQIKWSCAASVNEEDKTLVEMDETEYSFYKENNLSVMTFSPQAKGFFAKLASGKPLSEKAAARYDCPGNRKKYERAKILAQEKNVSITAVILGYLKGADFHTVPIVGCSSLSMIEDSLKDADLMLTKQERDFLDSV